MRTITIKQIVETLKEVNDPEININIVDLGLIYGIKVDDNNNIVLTLTMTSPMCPVTSIILADVQLRLDRLPQVGKVDIELVWEPAWSAEMISDEYKSQLGV
ncbi:MAG: iron-sulfur cluster assembly protein [Candidatus Micrarchaeaceae archaeon]